MDRGEGGVARAAQDFVSGVGKGVRIITFIPEGPTLSP